jgi:hypothetical protein
MRGIDFDVRNRRGLIVSPLQGYGNLILDVYLGLRAGRSTPGYHIAGFQP